MRTLRSVNSARLRKGLMGATAWLASTAVLSLSAVPAYAQSAPPVTTPPATTEPVPTESAPVTDAPPVQGPSPEAPVTPEGAVQGPSPDATVEPLPEAVQEVPPPTDITAPADIGPAEPPNHTASYVLWTASVVSLGIGTAYGVMALKAKKDFDDDPTTKRADKSHDRGIAADVSLGLGVILAATGLAFYFAKDGEGAERGVTSTSARAKPARADVSVAPYVGRSAGGGNLSVRF